MDALALLCTLHADGPATLKRLRAMGCGSLALLLERDVDALAEGLGVPAPAARRLLREARLLRDRVGVEALEAEEAPPAAVAAPLHGGGSSPRRPALPVEVGEGERSALQPSDHDLVARIVATGSPDAEAPADRGMQVSREALASRGALEDHALEGDAPPARDRVPDTASSDSAPSDSASSGSAPSEPGPSEPAPAGPTAFGAGVVDGAAPEQERGAAAAGEEPVAREPVAREPVAPEPVASEPEARTLEPGTSGPASQEVRAEGPAEMGACELRLGSLPGLDAALLEDLLAAGLDTYASIAAAETLGLTRSLGVSFAQARRMRFLARREADAIAAAPGASEPRSPGEPMPGSGRLEGAAPPPEPSATEVLTAPEGAGEPARELAPGSGPGPARDATPTGERTFVVPAAGRVDALPGPERDELAREAQPDAPAAAGAGAGGRHAFWESRLLREREEAEESATEGVPVDPSEIEAPPRFGERFARAAAEGRLRRSGTAQGRTVLGWNFEVPRPAAEDLPLASLGRPEPTLPESAEGSAEAEQRRDDAAPAEGDDVAAGPFA